MNYKEAIKELKQIPNHIGQDCDGYELRALRMAIQALEQAAADGCEGCIYQERDPFEQPCLICKRSKMDYWSAKMVDDCILTCKNIAEAYKQGRQDALNEAEEKIKAYGSVWMSYTDTMSKEQVANEALRSAKESMVQILEKMRS